MNASRGVARLIVLLMGLGAVFGAQAARAIFATGCFWSSESDFEDLPGVTQVTSGYTGGYVQAPTYEQVGSGLTGHAEAVEVVYDPAQISYEQLLAHFWRTHDPFDVDGQFCDQGMMYRPVIFWLDMQQKQAAEQSRARQQKRFSEPIQTHIARAERFWPAEAAHQDFRRRNPARYAEYRVACGRDRRLREVWGEASASDRRPAISSMVK